MTNFEIAISLVLIAYGLIFGIVCAGLFSRTRRNKSGIEITNNILNNHDSCINRINNRINFQMQMICDKLEDINKEGEIRVGDEVIYIGESCRRFVVTQINPRGGKTLICGFDGYGSFYCDKSIDHWKKTGRHFDGVAELLKKMRVDTNSEIEKED